MTIAPLSPLAASMNVDAFFAEVHEAIPHLSDAELVETHAQAQQLGRLAWQVEAHCLAEAKRRKAHHNDGGIKAVAAGFGLSQPRATARIRIWEAFGEDFRCRKSDRILTEVSWYEKASESANPRRWLDHAEDQKAANPFYTIRDFCDEIAADEREQAREPIELHTPPIGGARYGVILADPPWQYERSTNQLEGTTSHHYGDLSIADLCALPVSDVAAKDAILLLWTTWPQLTEAMQLVEAWGFKYLTGFPWIKITGQPQVNLAGAINAKPQYGVGFWTRGCSEPILIARRGNVSPPNDGWVGLISPNFQHSRKPENLYDFAESLPGPYIELFARRTRPGWVSLGNEIDKKDIRDSLAEVIG